MQQMREQLEQQALQTRQALAQLLLVREQLITETNARIEAQVCIVYNFIARCLIFVAKYWRCRFGW